MYSDILIYHLQMEAPAAFTSSIKVHFGDKVHKGAATPLHLSLILDFFSKEQEQVRKWIAESLNTEVPSSAIVLELTVTGNSKDIAEKLNSSETVKSINQANPNLIKYFGLGNKVYALIESLFEFPEEEFQAAKPQNSNESAQIYLNIFSQNDLTRISELLKEKGLPGFLDSLEFSFEFTKNKTTEGIILVILEKMGFNGINQVIQSFRRINFELNGASSRILSEFPKITFDPLKPKGKNDASIIFAEAGITEAQVFLLNKTLFLKGKLEVNGLGTFIETIYNT